MTLADDLRPALEGAFERADSDERRGPILRAADLKLKLEVADLELSVSIRSADGPERNIEWAFEAPPGGGGGQWLTLTVDSATLSSVLLGNESLAIAVARGKVRIDGSARSAMRQLPAFKQLCDCYERVVAEDFPHLAKEPVARG